MTTNDAGRGAYHRVTDPAGTTYLVHAVPSGHLDWFTYFPQGPIGLAVQTVGVKIVNRVVFRGGWTVLAWRSDVYAPKRERVHKQRFPGQAEAVAAFDQLVATISATGMSRPVTR